MAEAISEFVRTCRSFPTTHWSAIERACQSDETAAQQALDGLLRRYSEPLKSHLLYKFRASPEQAEDWFQSFVLKKILLNRLLAQARRDKGHFRSFLLTSLDNFVLNELRHESCPTRCPAAGTKPIDDLPQAEQNMLVDDTNDPGAVEWVRTTLEVTLQRMRSQCEATDQVARWLVFQWRVLDPLLDGGKPVPYERLVSQLNLASPAIASNLLVTAKRMFARLLKEVISEYTKPGEVEDELRDLKRILAQAGPRGLEARHVNPAITKPQSPVCALEQPGAQDCGAARVT